MSGPLVHRRLPGLGLALLVLTLGLIGGAVGPASAQDNLRRASDLSLQLDNAARNAGTGAARVRGRLNAAQAATAHAIGVALARNPDVGAVQRQWQGLVGAPGLGTVDIDALVLLIMQEATRQANADLKAALERLKSHTRGDDAQLANIDLQNVLQKSSRSS